MLVNDWTVCVHVYLLPADVEPNSLQALNLWVLAIALILFHNVLLSAPLDISFSCQGQS